MTDSIKHLVNQFNLQTQLFKNVTSGINDNEATKRMNDNTNHMAWLTGHTVSTRYMLAGALGLTEKEPFPSLFENGKGLDKNANYPSMQALTKDWDSITSKVVEKLKSMPQEALSSKMPRPVPTGDTVGDFISFIAHHEAYTIGQLGIYRRFHGKEAMQYNG